MFAVDIELKTQSFQHDIKYVAVELTFKTFFLLDSCFKASQQETAFQPSPLPE